MQLEMDFGNTKRCSKCKETKDTVEFSKAKKRKDGLYPYCKSCDKELYVKRRDYRIENPPPTPATKQCTLCKETKVAVEFSKAKKTNDGLQPNCKSCNIERARKLRDYRKTNPPPTPATKRCYKCKETKVSAEFDKNVSSKDGHTHDCKSCAQEKARRIRIKLTKRNTLAGPPDRTGTKKCPDCGETKQKTEFHITRSFTDGLAGRCKPCGSVRALQWAKDNPAKVNANSARRKAGKLKATPKWEDKSKTQWYYDESQRVTAETGVVHHVDHMVPLNHWSVRGLHWHMNFEVLPGAENMSKGNRFWSGDGWSDWSDYYKEFYEEFQQLKEYALWLKNLTSHARNAHLATLTTSTQLQAKATVTPVATVTVTSAKERNNEKTCQPSA